jgi:1-deoxy-D-xylulose-5-phosphate synthase
VAAGVTAGLCVTAARELDGRGIGATVVDPRWLIPTHPDLPHLAARHRLVVTVEDGVRSGGVGAALAMACADEDVATPVRVVGLPKDFLAAGGRDQILGLAGTTAADVVAVAVAELTPERTSGSQGIDITGSVLADLGTERRPVHESTSS